MKLDDVLLIYWRLNGVSFDADKREAVFYRREDAKAFRALTGWKVYHMGL